MLANTSNIDSSTGKMYLANFKVQEFLGISDPQLKSKLMMMQLSKGSPFGMDVSLSSSKVYGDLQIVDGYSGAGIPESEERKAGELSEDFLMPASVFEAKLVDEGKLT